MDVHRWIQSDLFSVEYLSMATQRKSSNTRLILAIALIVASDGPSRWPTPFAVRRQGGGSSIHFIWEVSMIEHRI